MKHLLLTTIAAVLLVGTAFADPIHDAANIGDIGDVQAELDAGVDVNAKDNLGTFRYAASGGHKEIVELLIAEGADVNATDDGWMDSFAFCGWKWSQGNRRTTDRRRSECECED